MRIAPLQPPPVMTPHQPPPPLPFTKIMNGTTVELPWMETATEIYLLYC